MYHTECGLEKTLKVIGAKWTILILKELCVEKQKRFGQILNSLPGISPRTLSLRLDQLERAGVIKRQAFAEVPLRVEYSLTDKGESLREIVDTMKHWGDNHQ